MDYVWNLEGEIRKNGGIALRARTVIDGKEVKTLQYCSRTVGRAGLARITEDVLKDAKAHEAKNRSR